MYSVKKLKHQRMMTDQKDRHKEKLDEIAKVVKATAKRRGITMYRMRCYISGGDIPSGNIAANGILRREDRDYRIKSLLGLLEGMGKTIEIVDIPSKNE